MDILVMEAVFCVLMFRRLTVSILSEVQISLRIDAVGGCYINYCQAQLSPRCSPSCQLQSSWLSDSLILHFELSQAYISKSQLAETSFRSLKKLG